MGLKAGGSFVFSENWNPDGVAHAQKALGWGGGGGTQGREQALQVQTGTQGNAMLRLGLDPQGLADALLKPKASSMFRKWLGLDLILLLGQTPPISDLQEWNEPFTGNGLPGNTAVH